MILKLDHASLFPQESSSCTFYVRVTFNSATFTKSSEFGEHRTDLPVLVETTGKGVEKKKATKRVVQG